ncbi:hypothetical protein ZYGR_0AS05720 [Zygosaccharomyces rouxii]|uniref:Arrestin C-terminal-like domain-containing protein n=1 Tax=Zygosaccharomyces rouxii TaxID=4956 RepID=A0A1Q3AHP0_ZYGRO|nr:hypothetical protein ZYGR_0AS05720 [Zygosaccharomyces rouxii]
MPNPSSSGTAKYGKASFPLRRSSSIRNTLTSILGSNSAHKNNSSNRNNSNSNNSNDGNSTTSSLRRNDSSTRPPSSSMNNGQTIRRTPTKTRNTSGMGGQLNRSPSEPKRSNTVSGKPRNVMRPADSSGSRSSPSAAASIASSTVSGSTINEAPETTTPKSSTRSLQRSASMMTPRSKGDGNSTSSLSTTARSSTRNSVSSSTRPKNGSNSAPRSSWAGTTYPVSPPSTSGPMVNETLEEDEAYTPNLLPPPQMGVSAPPPPPSAKEFLNEYLTQRGLLKPKTVYERSELKISISSSGDHVFLPTMSCNDDEYLARLNGFREDEDFEVLDTAESRENNARNNATGGGLSRSSSNGNLRSRPSTASFHSSNPFRQSSSNSLDSGSPPSFEMDESMAPLTIAVIVSVPKPTKLTSIETQLCSLVRIHWYAGVPPTRSFQEENYSAGALNWSLGTDNMNVFIPLNVSSKEKIIENNRNIRQMSLFRNIPDNQKIYLEKGRIRKDLIGKTSSKRPQAMQPGDYVYIIPVAFSNHIPESLYLPSARVHYKFCVAAKMQDGKSRSLSEQQQKAIQEERQQESEMNNHKKFGLLKKIKGGHLQNGLSPIRDTAEDPNETYTEYPIYVIRTPPPISISTANKPIYIDRVWTDSLAYEVSFAQKYVALGSKVPVKIKLEPLTPDVFVKRVRVSIVEKITFVSKNYEFEYDQVDPVARDPYNPYFNEFAAKRKKERSLSLLEIRTRDKGGRAVKEEIVDNCVNDNLLAYNTEGGVDPFYIETNVEFPCYEDLEKNTAKQLPPYGVDAYANVPNPEAVNTQPSSHHGIFQSSNNNTPGRRNSVMGFLANRKSSLSPTPKSSSGDLKRKPSFSPTPNQCRSPPPDQRFHETKLRNGRGITVKKHTRLNKPRRGLYLDSLHFTNIHSRHKLEVMLRISKPDAIDPTKLRHYEVLIDTPIFLISEKCSEGNMELPTYSDAINDPLSPCRPPNLTAPPTFEEAISVPASPIQSPLGSPALSPQGASSFSPPTSPLGSPMGSPRRRSDHVPKDSDIQHLSLASVPTLAPPENSPHLHSPSAPGANANFPNGDHMFNNLDKLMSSPANANGRKDDGNSGTSPIGFQGISNVINSDDLDMTRPKFNESPERLTTEKTKGGFSSEPPKYDEIMH